MLHADRIFYNRVPKCGSSATMGVIAKLRGTANGVPFQFRHSRIYHTERLPSIRAGTQVVKRLDNRNGAPRIIYNRHLYFLNFEMYNRTNPLYINMVRKPVQRFLSEYYFHRFEHPKKMPRAVRNRTFDDCVLNNYTECQTRAAFVIIPFFCGQEPMCTEPSRAALEKAKYNVDKFYGVVGLTEDLLTSFALFEQTSPKFFKRMTLVAARHLDSLKSKFRTHKKPQPSDSALQVMDSRLALENEFYDFVKTRYLAFVEHFQTRSFVNEALREYEASRKPLDKNRNVTDVKPPANVARAKPQMPVKPPDHAKLVRPGSSGRLTNAASKRVTTKRMRNGRTKARRSQP